MRFPNRFDEKLSFVEACGSHQISEVRLIGRTDNDADEVRRAHMKTARNGNGRGDQSPTATYLIRLTDGRSVPLELITSLNTGRTGHMTPTPEVQVLTRESQFELLPDGAAVHQSGIRRLRRRPNAHSYSACRYRS